jgi:SAM-dependent methyltransferase
MLQDFTNQYIAQLLAHCPIKGNNVLEIGCGKGRITRDLVDHAYHVMAIDPDSEALAYARKGNYAANVTFRRAELTCPPFPPRTFDVVLFSLSLHHIPAEKMLDNLIHASELLDENGVIAIIEPDDGGSLTFAKRAFGNSDNNRKERTAALRASRELPGWQASLTVLFDVLWQFNDETDFLTTMFPGWGSLASDLRSEVKQFLARHTTNDGIILDAGRKLIVLRRSELS